MRNFIKKLFKKPNKNEGLKIRFKSAVMARLAKPPPEGLFHIAIDQNVIVTKESILVYHSEDNTFIYFRVLNHFFAVKDQAPDKSIVYFSHYHLTNLEKTKQFKRL